MADAFCFLGNEKSKNLVLIHVRQLQKVIFNINDFLSNDMVSIQCIYLIIWCILVDKQKLLHNAVFSLAIEKEN